MPGVWTALGLVLLCLSPQALGDPAAELQCYSCKSMEGMPYAEDCVEYSDRTHMTHCHPDARFCKKQSMRQGNRTYMERTCERDCLPQTGIYLCASDIHVDVYCCTTDLCNHGSSLTTAWVPLGVALTLAWRLLS